MYYRFLLKTDSVILVFSSHLAFFFFIQFSRYDFWVSLQKLKFQYSIHIEY